MESSSNSGFVRFPPETQRFLAELGARDDPRWLDENRATYEECYVKPAKAFVVAAGQALRQFAPAIRAEPKILGSIFRVTRDTRFGPRGRPFKDHLDFYFWEGERRFAVSSFFMRVSPAFVGIGVGCHGFERDELGLYREALTDTDSGTELAAIARNLETGGYVLRGLHYRRDPRGFEVEEAVKPFLRYKALYVHHNEPAQIASEPGVILQKATYHWHALALLHRWLTDRVQTRHLAGLNLAP